MFVELDAEVGGPVNDVVTIDFAGESFILAFSFTGIWCRWQR